MIHSLLLTRSVHFAFLKHCCMDMQVVPGELTIITGVPNSGKSEWIDALMVNLSNQFGWRFGLCSMEKKVQHSSGSIACCQLHPSVPELVAVGSQAQHMCSRTYQAHATSSTCTLRYIQLKQFKHMYLYLCLCKIRESSGSIPCAVPMYYSCSVGLLISPFFEMHILQAPLVSADWNFQPVKFLFSCDHLSL